MKRIRLLAALIVLLSLNAFSAKPVLKFKNHQFRIVQFTDVHWFNDARFEKDDDSTFILMRKIIEIEHPDMVVFTGDIIVSAGAKVGWVKLENLMSEYKIPFAVTFGNHEPDGDISNQQILSLLEKSSYNLTYNADKLVTGVGNCSLPILSENRKATRWLIYLFDSHAYSKDKSIKVSADGARYDWIRHDQIEWYRKQSASYAKKNGKSLPALAFFHIPLPEFREIENGKGIIGNHFEASCPPTLNTGLFASFKEMNDVLGVFCGHDHNNDFLGTLDNICLGYGRKTGYAFKNEVLERGARIIDIYEDNAKFDTYIRTLSGQYFNYTFERK